MLFLVSNATTTRAPPQTFMALYGEVKMERKKLLKNLLGGTNTCQRFAMDGHCLESRNSLILQGLKPDREYGVVLCAVLDHRNLTVPSLVGDNVAATVHPVLLQNTCNSAYG